MSKHLQRTAAFIKIIIIGKKIAEFNFQLHSCFIRKVKDIHIIGIESAVAPEGQQVYSITGLVLHTQQVLQQPKTGLSQESKQLSGQDAFCCKINMT